MKNKKNNVDRYIDSLHDITDKTVIITGANSGIGYEIAKIALIKGAHVIMACRNGNRANIAKEQLIKETGSNKVDIEIFDQSSVKSIDHFVDVIKDKYSNFYALVLNAGIFLPKDKLDEHHISRVYKTNFIGPSILLKRLEPFFNKSTNERRIIIQGSLASFYGKYRNKDKLIHGKYAGLKTYHLSKLCISNLFIKYRDNNTNPNVKYLLCEPGIAATKFFDDYPKWFKKIAVGFVLLMWNSARDGSLSGCHLLCEEVENGDYYRPRGLRAAKGLPKKAIFPKNYIDKKIILDSEEIIKIYESER